MKRLKSKTTLRFRLLDVTMQESTNTSRVCVLRTSGWEWTSPPSEPRNGICTWSGPEAEHAFEILPTAEPILEIRIYPQERLEVDGSALTVKINYGKACESNRQVENEFPVFRAPKEFAGWIHLRIWFEREPDSPRPTASPSHSAQGEQVETPERTRASHSPRSPGEGEGGLESARSREEDFSPRSARSDEDPHAPLVGDSPPPLPHLTPRLLELAAGAAGPRRPSHTSLLLDGDASAPPRPPQPAPARPPPRAPPPRSRPPPSVPPGSDVLKGEAGPAVARAAEPERRASRSLPATSEGLGRRRSAGFAREGRRPPSPVPLSSLLSAVAGPGEAEAAKGAGAGKGAPERRGPPMLSEDALALLLKEPPPPGASDSMLDDELDAPPRRWAPAPPGATPYVADPTELHTYRIQQPRRVSGRDSDSSEEGHPMGPRRRDGLHSPTLTQGSVPENPLYAEPPVLRWAAPPLPPHLAAALPDSEGPERRKPRHRIREPPPQRGGAIASLRCFSNCYSAFRPFSLAGREPPAPIQGDPLRPVARAAQASPPSGPLRRRPALDALPLAPALPAPRPVGARPRAAPEDPAHGHVVHGPADGRGVAGAAEPREHGGDRLAQLWPCFPGA
eukprot:tig00021623_g23012.t2